MVGRNECTPIVVNLYQRTQQKLKQKNYIYIYIHTYIHTISRKLKAEVPCNLLCHQQRVCHSPQKKNQCEEQNLHKFEHCKLEMRERILQVIQYQKSTSKANQTRCTKPTITNNQNYLAGMQYNC